MSDRLGRAALPAGLSGLVEGVVVEMVGVKRKADVALGPQGAKAARLGGQGVEAGTGVTRYVGCSATRGRGGPLGSRVGVASTGRRMRAEGDEDDDRRTKAARVDLRPCGGSDWDSSALSEPPD